MFFQYKVRNQVGDLSVGQLQATSIEEATRRLLREGLDILNIDIDDSMEGGLFPKPIRRSDIIYLTTQIAIMVQTGITLSTALDSLAGQESNPRLRAVLEDLRRRVESGEDFSAALAAHPKHFDQTYVALVRASEATGTLDEMLDRIAQYQRRELEMRSRVRSALAYPLVMLCVATGVTIFLITYILPKFTPLFTRRGMVLPLPTRILLGVSHAFTAYWGLWLVGLVALVVGAIYGRRTKRGRDWIDSVKIDLPLLGTMFRKVAISRSIRTLGAMVNSGVPMLEALQLTAEVAGNTYFYRLWKKVQDHVTAGHQIHTALAQDPTFPKTLVQMIASGEETGKLDVVLAKVSGYYDQEVETTVKTVTTLIEPILIGVMGFVVGGIGMALMLPIFSLSRPS